MSDALRPITILIGALGGDGGGVLCDWIAHAAHETRLPAQVTQIPGVAQRTGATTYYIEIVPLRRAALSGREPVMALNPAIGEVDVALATELLEAGRMIFNGFVTPDRTTLIASTHRVLSIGERVAMADGKFDTGRLLHAVRERSRERILFDMDQAAEESGSVLNAILLGALAGSGKLPVPDSAFESAIRSAGKSVEPNLAGFAFGRAHARGELEQAVRSHHARRAAGRGVEDLILRVQASLPPVAQPIAEEGVRRLTAYQDRAYATLYLDRLGSIRAAEQAAGGAGSLTRETARHLAVRMSFEDVIRVAQAKVAPDRMARIRAEIRAKPTEPVLVIEHFKPGIEEIAAILPPGLARRLLRWGERTGRTGKLYFPMRIKTSSVSGFLRLRFLAGLRWWRPRSFRFIEEQAQIERWLAAIRHAAALDLGLAAEIAECARLVKGYGDTHRRGSDNFARIDREIVAPALAGALAARVAADGVASARVAALADPDGDALARTLADFRVRATPLVASP